MNTSQKKTIYIFWGPAGNGTTTSLVKYAINNYKIDARKEAILLTNNDFTIGAKFKLKEFSKISDFSYGFISINSKQKEIENLSTFNKLFFDLHSKEPLVTIEKLAAIFDKDFQIKKIFVLNALLLPYTTFLTRFSNFEADEIILTNMDYTLSISDSEKEKIIGIIKKLSKSIPVWISEGPLVPEDFYKFNN